MNIAPEEIINFWYSDKIKKAWFSSTPDLDYEILEKFEGIWEQAFANKLDNWSNTPEGCLALIIILDQFPLNMFREQAKSFKSASKAIEVAWRAVSKQFDLRISKEKRVFLYMPFMHSEKLKDQDMSVKLYKESNLHENVRFAEHHREIIRKFGRFPHRNKILKRKSTVDELAYLTSKNAFTG